MKKRVVILNDELGTMVLGFSRVLFYRSGQREELNV